VKPKHREKFKPS
jgi:hypothetical protein